MINLVSKVPGLPDASIKIPDQFEQPAVEMFTNGYVPSFASKNNRDIDGSPVRTSTIICVR